MTDQEINEIASRVLASDTSRPGFLGSETISDLDFDGAEVLRVTAHYEHMPHIARPLDAMHAIRAELLGQGEDRTVFLTNKYRDELPSIEDDAA